MIECKTFGGEYEKELKRIKHDGGQLFTYFQQDKSADLLMLYTSRLDSNGISHKNAIIKIEQEYRDATTVVAAFNLWNKITEDTGVWECPPYGFRPKALTFDKLKPLEQRQSSYIFNQFLEILRHNVVSDKPNAFNKIFSLFLCKIHDEAAHDVESKEERDEPLDFQWFEGESDETFQLRLTDLYKKGMAELLDKHITDISEQDFNRKYAQLDESKRLEILEEIKRLRLQKSNEFAIKDVFDAASFADNAKVVKEVVQLLQPYRLRYTHKNQFLSDFFELLLTTGLKQEAGQFFTPVPVTQFILRSLPLDVMISEKLESGKKDHLLPYIIDYAAGSGHFLTESMDAIQHFLEHETDRLQLTTSTRKFVKAAREENFNWAGTYIYGVEKDYRLVKVGKVGCHLHGDGLANVIHSDGLARFDHPDWQGTRLGHADRDFPMENRRFDVVVSNPPYSVSAFKNVARDFYTEKDFDLYRNLTDTSPEIEALFVERTKQLLGEGGIAGIILPVTILNKKGIYAEARNILLRYFEIVAIAQFDKNTFMATDTSTIVLFLRRTDNYLGDTTQEQVDRFFVTFNDATMNRVEHPVKRYVQHVWKGITLEDYRSLARKKPCEAVMRHELFQEYRKKLYVDRSAKNKRTTKAAAGTRIQHTDSLEKSKHDFLDAVIAVEKEKILHFVLAFRREVTLVDSGQKEMEKYFLGYEFSERRKDEGIHPFPKGAITIEENGQSITREAEIADRTMMFDEHSLTHPAKASTYIRQAFLGEQTEIDPAMQPHVSWQRLIDMLVFDRASFDKVISTAVKKKVMYEGQHPLARLGAIASTQYGHTAKATNKGKIRYLRITDLNDDGTIRLDNEAMFINPDAETLRKFQLEHNDLVVARSGSVGKTGLYDAGLYDPMIFASYLVRVRVAQDKILPRYLLAFTSTEHWWAQVAAGSVGANQPNLNAKKIAAIEIPLPPLAVQHTIVSEIEEIEQQQRQMEVGIKKMEQQILSVFQRMESQAISSIRLGERSLFEVSIGQRVLKREIVPNGQIPIYSANVFSPFGRTDKRLIHDFSVPSVLWGIDGDWMVNHLPANMPFYPTDHCGVLRVKDKAVDSRYLAFLLDKEGKRLKFSRDNRASIDRVEGIKIPIPPAAICKKMTPEIERLEKEIIALRKKASQAFEQKGKIFKKHID